MYALHIYDMRQTNLKLDPRGPTELLLLSTVELVYRSIFNLPYTLILLLYIRYEKCATLYRTWLTEDQILMIAWGHL